ncbi:MAG TPA: LysR family transcriptional regulator [Candidatus Lustribacter sp.]|nr:LysR family transcriptional regulator [Candidatus Lustribacter sp.]
MSVDTEALRWFQQVADGVTVTEVADIHLVSQPGVSRALARLEDEVGTPLLGRSGRVLRLTHAGSAFKRHVDALINNLDDGLAAVDQLVDPERGIVSVAFQLSLGLWLVPELVSSFRAEHPGVHFVLSQVRDELLSPVLAGGRVDLEITARRPVGPQVRWRRLVSEPLFIGVPAGHPLAGRSEITLAQVSAERFVALRLASLLRQQSHVLCAAAGFEPQIAVEADDLPTLRAFVVAGLGVAIVPAMGHDPAVAGPGAVRLVPITDPEAVRDVGLVWSTERRLLPAAELFRRHVLSTAE